MEVEHHRRRLEAEAGAPETGIRSSGRPLAAVRFVGEPHEVVRVSADNRQCCDVRDLVRMALDDVCDELVEQRAAGAEERAGLGGRLDGALPPIDARDRVDEVGGGG